MPKVSICIPAYNQTKYLRKTIDSVLSQTYTDYEIVITDDSPGDVVKTLVQQYNLPDIIMYYKNASPLGSPENWNECLRRSTGEYIKILHHDDWLNYDNSLSKYVAMLDNNPTVNFAFSAAQAIDPANGNWEHRPSDHQIKELKDNPSILYFNNVVGAPSNTIFRRNGELFDRNLKWLVDIEFYIRQIRANNNIIYSPELLAVTMVAEDRVTIECRDNKEVEIPEYLYVLQKLSEEKSFARPVLKACTVKAIAICDKHSVKNVAQIRAWGYSGKIPGNIRKYLSLKNSSPLAARAFLKVFRSSLKAHTNDV